MMLQKWKKINLYLAYFAGILLAFVMVIVVIDVFLRIVFNRPIAGVVDLVSVLMPIFLFLPLAYAGITEGHIRVEVLTTRMSPRKQLVFDILACICGIILLSLFSWQSWNAFWESWQTAEYYPGLSRIRVYPARFSIALGFTLLDVHLAVRGFAAMKAVLFSSGSQQSEN